jgi:hypothetical protein
MTFFELTHVSKYFLNFASCFQHYFIRRHNLQAIYDQLFAVPLHAMEALVGRGSIAPTHS